MAKFKFDAKQIKTFLFERGEFVALFAALGLVGLVLIYTVYVAVAALEGGAARNVLLRDVHRLCSYRRCGQH